MSLAQERFTVSTYSRHEIALDYQDCVGLEYNPTTSSEASFAWLPGTAAVCWRCVTCVCKAVLL